MIRNVEILSTVRRFYLLRFTVTILAILRLSKFVVFLHSEYSVRMAPMTISVILWMLILAEKWGWSAWWRGALRPLWWSQCPEETHRFWLTSPCNTLECATDLGPIFHGWCEAGGNEFTRWRKWYIENWQMLCLKILFPPRKHYLEVRGRRRICSPHMQYPLLFKRWQILAGLSIVE